MEQKNAFLAIILSILVWGGFQYFAPAPQPVAPQEQTADGVATPQPGSSAPTALETPTLETIRDKAEVLAESPRVKIESPVLTGSINLRGARLDDLVLPEFKETLDEDSKNIVLLRPEGTKGAFFASMGMWASKGVEAPKADTVWSADREILTPGNSVTLSWTNPAGVVFQQVYSLDEHYLFTIEQKVINNSADEIQVAPYGTIRRLGTPQTEGFYILHEGFTGVLDESLKEESYENVQDAEKGTVSFESEGGWVAITDKYWQTALLPDQGKKIKAQYLAKASGNDFNYTANFINEQSTVLAPGAAFESKDHIFAGAKKAILIDEYKEQLELPLFDRSVDFGYFHFLTRPMYYIIHWLNEFLGNFGLAILALTLGIKIILLPLAHKSYVSMSRMKLLQPKMQELKEKHGDDRQKLNMAMMELYKKEKVNPLAGCLPILVQIPIFFALYKVLFINIEMRHAPFFGWIQDLSAPDPLGLLTGFGLIEWQVPAMLAFFNVGIWPLIMGLTMWLQQKLNPAPADPIQQKIFTFMPIIFTFMLGTFPAGLVIYWAWNNTLSIAQQYLIMKKMGVAVGGGAAKAS
ncbi:membrane protein insertase YidC [Aestuariispira insulae]|uniref:Membrane protein insertase YidC n=1 Tax=Aestuariispira insulae TaxID=1461337 RepID=A0A3D9H6D8_9PROT|nr:membrane protein insertase YidC [Aestuariispira insulae]RED45032.1 YidC/Oxa1 family membrane protein insertase [Aestuariispira insulae]